MNKQIYWFIIAQIITSILILIFVYLINLKVDAIAEQFEDAELEIQYVIEE